VEFYRLFGYLSGLFIARPDMEPAALLPTAALCHTLDAVLCRVIAGHSGRHKTLWTLAGLIFGIWALGILFLLPEKRNSLK
jgi:hypothetical protein